MTALSAKRITKSRGLTRKVRYLMANGVTVYAGGMVCLNSSGLAIPAAAASDNRAVLGIAVESVTSADATTWCEVVEGEFLMDAQTIAQDDVFKIVYADDDATVDDAQATDAPVAGRLIEYVSASSGWVRIGPSILVA